MLAQTQYPQRVPEQSPELVDSPEVTNKISAIHICSAIGQLRRSYNLVKRRARRYIWRHELTIHRGHYFKSSTMGLHIRRDEGWRVSQMMSHWMNTLGSTDLMMRTENRKKKWRQHYGRVIPYMACTMLKHALLILRRHRGTNHGCTGSIETEVYLNAQPWK